MTTYFTPRTPTTPSYTVDGDGSIKSVYVDDRFKGSVERLPLSGYLFARDITRTPITDENGKGLLWDNERDALDFVARS